jgi:hypothetical protein
MTVIEVMRECSRYAGHGASRNGFGTCEPVTLFDCPVDSTQLGRPKPSSPNRCVNLWPHILRPKHLVRQWRQDMTVSPVPQATRFVGIDLHKNAESRISTGDGRMTCRLYPLRCCDSMCVSATLFRRAETLAGTGGQN